MDFFLYLLAVPSFFICIIPIFFIVRAFYDSYKKSKVRYIFGEVEKLYGFSFERYHWNHILDEIYIHKGLFRKHINKHWFRYYHDGKIEHYFGEELSNVVYQRALNSSLPFLDAYVYSFMQAAHTFSKGTVNYDFFQYCEKKLLGTNLGEQRYMHLSLNFTLLKNPQFITGDNGHQIRGICINHYQEYATCLTYLCQELIFINYPEKYKLDYDRVALYVKNAYEKIKKEHTDVNKVLLDELCTAYIDTLSSDSNQIRCRNSGQNIFDLRV